MNDGSRVRARSLSFLRIPAVRALFIQCACLVLLLLLARAYHEVSGKRMDLIGAVLVQGLFAAVGSRWAGLALWWILIQFCFPLAILLTFILHLPPAAFLLAFLLLLVLYWSCFRTQVPYYPSSRFAERALQSQLPVSRPLRVIDIGSGLGGLLINLAVSRPESQFVGIELAPLPWLISYCRARIGRHKVQFIRGDYQDLDFSGFDVVFAYLSPAAMSCLWTKACAEMHEGSLLFSYEFLIEEKGPDVTISDENSGSALYGWRI